MTNRERTGQRDLAFSRWHRQLPNHFDAADIDLVGYCHIKWCRCPLYMIEDTRSTDVKATTMIEQTARMAGCPAWLVRYWDDEDSIDGTAEMVWPDRGHALLSLDEFGMWIRRARAVHAWITHMDEIAQRWLFKIQDAA